MKSVSNWPIVSFWNELWFNCLKYTFWIVFLKNTIHCYCLDKFIFFSIWNISSFEREISLHSFCVWLLNVFISYFFSFCSYYRSFSIIFTYRFHFLFLIILILFEWWNNQMKQWWYEWNCDYYFFKLKFWCIDFWDLSITHFRQKNSKNCIHGISVIGTFSYFFGIFTNY